MFLLRLAFVIHILGFVLFKEPANCYFMTIYLHSITASNAVETLVVVVPVAANKQANINLRKEAKWQANILCLRSQSRVRIQTYSDAYR